ncbi:MAG: Abhydrolase [Candidatus Tokpelaia hoelldobleri]|uniref:Palmitoyl-protein thioesterase ABHD10, mitochondrial n=1 Tax=Candidatus Tokpelaia hoelldobleri TaxID=1902579 RepID=A0A1U9JSE2_9HYPH|nr:MAG: Abhydrolase [Candidatus Tokpelaia hoelldoblerii]
MQNEKSLQFIQVDGVDIAVRYRAGERTPGLVWLGGYRSDMLGTKAVALDTLAEQAGVSCLRHDYSGHGESGGAFPDGTISLWLKQSLAVYERFAVGDQVLIGSSMGCWIALRMVQELKKRGVAPAGIVLIAPAPDFTKTLIEAAMSDGQRVALEQSGVLEVPTEYGVQIYTGKLIEDGRNNLVLDGIIETGCPVHILQGMQDSVVPYHDTLELMEHLPVDDVTLTLVKDGDHRLSRPQDIALLEQTVQAMLVA